MLALDFAWLVAKTTVGPIMARLVTAVRAVQEVATALLTTEAMIGLDNKAVLPRLAVVAKVLANMATCQCVTTVLSAQVLVAVHILTAADLDFVTASRDRTRNNFMTNNLVLFIVKPAWKRCLNVTTWELNCDVLDDCLAFRWAYLTTLLRA
jgi:hypothetical protein